jgi:pimeloyl-ACP methyl ester carboxylesterase
MELSVMCSEDYPWLDLDADYSDTILGNAMLEGIEAQCAVWPRGEAPADFHEPFPADTPTLLLSGERDPVTPPSYAELAAEAYANSLHLVAPGRSHSVLRNACLQEIASAFIEAGSLEGLDTGCVETIGPSPFFRNLLGPDP